MTQVWTGPVTPSEGSLHAAAERSLRTGAIDESDVPKMQQLSSRTMWTRVRKLARWMNPLLCLVSGPDQSHNSHRLVLRGRALWMNVKHQLYSYQSQSMANATEPLAVAAPPSEQ